jgi:phosphoribosylformimino-5-aminoimidazole carboxamide ribotide isomerase
MIEVIPSIDIMNGSCVRLTKGDFTQVINYDTDPLTVAKRYEGLGFRRLHLVDLDGARSGEVVNINVLEKIAQGTELIIDFGGGIKTGETLRSVFNAGAAMVNLGSVAVSDQAMVSHWLDEYDVKRFILSADVRDRMVAFHAWQQTSDISISDFIKQYHSRGIRMISCTDINRDGLLEGPAIKLYQDLKYSFSDIYLIASGGVSQAREIEGLEDAGTDAVIIGRALYEIPGFPEQLAERFL